ncbi:bifunctional metallophosphatase/5'-nucleotidase [Lentilactobacillus sp. SPB1-3]|uniref:Bifunctional UDP-sugar hydrolase/5'-nucleotidase n=1 Tax=Lentilactobacillus terminaliae TaxID=3003483 RepID=A0ACD5DE06_9LACO|nr:bifunctional UDP-sugar hydrolase/5'-nucleotidase [Lentilactobacillus sp. SPB1-3]MCZ0977522.1 bifunctional UDP-sugar hydrolase/5'-nucleotidase [Lentilactobacillus sp. SPB1-3]
MKITILCTSDTHGFIEPTNYVDKGFTKPFGIGKASSAIQAYKMAHPDEKIIVIDNGDFLEGSPLSYFVAKKADSADQHIYNRCYNDVGYQLGTIGNHEFDYGLNYLKDVMKQSQRQFICANIVDHNNEPFLGKPYEIVDFGPCKVGFLGLSTTSTKKWKNVNELDDFNLISEIDTAAKYIPEMKKQADFIVAVYHGGFERDHTGTWTDINPGENKGYDLLENFPEIDAMISGHQHRKIAGHLFKKPIIQPGSRGEFVGRITLNISNSDKRITKGESELISVEDYPVDPRIGKALDPLSKDVSHWLDHPLARIKGNLSFDDPFSARIQDSAYMEFVHKVQMDKMGVDISATALYNNEAHGFSNPITMRNIITNYVYPNTLVVSEVSGEDIKDALEVSAEYFALKGGRVVVNEKFIFPKHRYYNYDMYEGIDYTLDISKPIGKRVTKLSYHGKPISPDQKLKVVLNRYRATGGGHYSMFTKDKIIKTDDTIISQIFLEYLQNHPVIEATNNQNFQVIPDNK